MTEFEAKVTGQLKALEYLAAHLLSVNYRSRRVALQDVRELHSNLLDQMAQTTVPGVSAAESDLLAGERAACAERVLALAESMLRKT
jgi:hypothetical protein